MKELFKIMKDPLKCRLVSYRLANPFLLLPLLLTVCLAMTASAAEEEVRITISPETTFITEPLTDDGKWIDYFKAFEDRFYPSGMKTDANGYRLIVEKLGPAPRSIDDSTPEEKNETENRARQIYEKLGLDPNIKPMLTFEDPHFFIQKHVNERLGDSINIYEEIKKIEDAVGKPWTGDEWPMMRDWLQENDAALGVVAEAARKSVFSAPIVYICYGKKITFLTITFDESHQMRSYARGLAVRARYRIGTGDLDGAIDDIIAIRRLGRHVGQRGFLIDGLIGIVVEGIGQGIGIADNPETPPSAEQIRRLIQRMTLHAI